MMSIEISKIGEVAILIHNEDPIHFVPVLDNTTGLFNLVITEVKESDEGEYRCIIQGLHKTWHFGQGIRLAMEGWYYCHKHTISITIVQECLSSYTVTVSASKVPLENIDPNLSIRLLIQGPVKI